LAWRAADLREAQQRDIGYQHSRAVSRGAY
jgi:hypothetical protein